MQNRLTVYNNYRNNRKEKYQQKEETNKKKIRHTWNVYAV